MDSNLKNSTMKDLPAGERPYEKCVLMGPEALTDAELLAVCLRCGSPGETAMELATRLLQRLHAHGGLRSLPAMTVEQLTECRGIGPVKAIQLRCMAELGLRLCRERSREELRMRTPETVAAYFMPELSMRTTECVMAAYFSTRGQLLHSSLISSGTVNGSLISPREVFLEALSFHAVYVTILHNHPSGDPTPSPEDLAVTEAMMNAGKMLGIPLMDHIIIGDHCYVSLKEQGYIP